MRVVIVGAGPGGLCMGVKLQAAGIEDFVILERSDGVGGTWRRNTYPGAACDVVSALYSFSFAFKPDWSRPYAPQPEILAHMEDVAASHGLLAHCRFDTEVVGAAWEEPGWCVHTASGEEITADILISALGMFNDIDRPDIDALDSFAGTMFHSAQWDSAHDLTGERVAVIGSAASAVQLVPEIVKVAGQVHLFQRTANWVLPKLDTPFTDRQLERMRADPSVMLGVRAEVFRQMDAGITFSDSKMCADREAEVLRAIDVVGDPDLREKLRPQHPFGCKRPLFSNDFYAAFNRPNLELVTDPIARVHETGVVTADGTDRTVDTIILATGFATTKYLSAIDVVGRAGRRIGEAWRDGAQAYLGVMTAGFPNLFMLYGPNTNNGSILTMLEHQADYVVAHLRRMGDEGIGSVDVRADAMDSYNDEIQAGIEGVAVWQAGCNGYYRTPSGRVVTQWPFSMSEYGCRVAAIDADAFTVV